MKLYYCVADNFGDALNRYIFEYCFGIKTEFANTWDADAIGIGSILDRCLLQVRDTMPYIKNKLFPTNKKLYVLSSGFGAPLEYYKKKPRFFKSTIIKRKIEVVSVRGHLTNAAITALRGGGGGKPLCFGDLGLLADLLVQNVPYKPIYDMGICPHGADRNSEIIDKIHKANPNSIILNTTGSPIEFLKKMKQCKTILSTGLHPLIAADSMGIPNLWGRISEIPTYHKFKDYYSVFNIEEELEPYYLDTNSITPDFIIDKYKLTSLIVEQVKQKLYDVHKKFFEEHKFN